MWYNDLVEHITRHKMSLLAVPILQRLWNVPVEHFGTPDTVRDLFVRFPDDIDLYRPIEKDAVVCAPCDGLAKLVTSSEDSVKKNVIVRDCCDTTNYSTLLIYPLMPNAFHHFFSPVDGVCIDLAYIKGRYRMDPTHMPCENVRVLVRIETTAHGVIDLILVGALGVASVRTFISKNDRLIKGQHIGHFDVGGSSVLLGIREPTNGLSFVPGLHRARAAVFRSS